MTKTKTREYVRQCERIPGEHKGKWIVQTYHRATGLPMSDDCCPHYATKREAQAHVGWDVREEED